MSLPYPGATERKGITRRDERLNCGRLAHESYAIPVGCMPLLGAACPEPHFKPSQSRNELFKLLASVADKLPIDLMTKL